MKLGYYQCTAGNYVPFVNKGIISTILNWHDCKKNLHCKSLKFFMKKIVVTVLSSVVFLAVNAQSINKIINTRQVKRIEKILAADDMEGRRTFTAGIVKASSFIESEFEKIGLQKFNGASDFKQAFFMYNATVTSASIEINGIKIADSMVVPFTYQPNVMLTQTDAVEVVKISARDKFGEKFNQYYSSKKNLLVLVDSTFNKLMKNINDIDKLSANPTGNTVVFVFAAPATADKFTIQIQTAVEKKPLNNVVGILPGKSKPDEYVIFSAHYDHLGTGSPDEGVPHNDKDSIYNGANDDAAGTTAVIMLARYFKKLNNNERSIVFAAFVAEEIGGFGAQYFSKQLQPEKVMSMFNIEMIGTTSKWGEKSAYLTGFEKSDMGKILQQNLEGSAFKFYPDPYPEQQLFYRSDNATLARLGVPAHTISTSKMDNEPYYHTAGDEIGTLDMKNMAAIIQAIAVSSATIISGKDTPTRVDTKSLR